jgi:hypothetical protein
VAKITGPLCKEAKRFAFAIIWGPDNLENLIEIGWDYELKNSRPF